MSKSALLRELLTSGDTLVMPDAYDPLSARIIESPTVASAGSGGLARVLGEESVE